MTAPEPTIPAVACTAEERGCGTPTGWRQGGRCPACRAAHNAESRRYRGVRPEQRRIVLDVLNAGGTVETAAQAADCSVATLQHSAIRDGELYAAMEGKTEAAQRVARQGDFLAALLRADGDMHAASQYAGIDAETVEEWRKDLRYVNAVSAVLRLLPPASPNPGRKKLSDAQLDHAAELMEQGMSIRTVAKWIGCSYMGVLSGAERHERLKKAVQNHKSRTPAPSYPQASGLTEEAQVELRELWADHANSQRTIARRLGVSQRTAVTWAQKLGLPPRQAPASTVD